MSPLKKRVHELVQAADFEGIDALVAEQPRAVRHLLSMTYHADPAISGTAARGVALASQYHASLVQQTVRQLVWAMNDESGTNALSAPAVLLAIASQRSELLLPMVPDLLRLCSDEGLRDGLSATLRIIAAEHPGHVGTELEQQLANPEQASKRDDERIRRYQRQRKLMNGEG